MSLSYYTTIKFKGSVFILSRTGECFQCEDYLEAMRTHEIRTVVNTSGINLVSSDRALVRAGLHREEVAFAIGYVPLPSVLSHWERIVSAHVNPRGEVRLAVHGLDNGCLLVALALRRLGMEYEAILKELLTAGSCLSTDQITFFMCSCMRDELASPRTPLCREKVAGKCCRTSDRVWS